MDLPYCLPQVYLSQLSREGPAGWTDILYPEFPLLWLSLSKGVFSFLEPKCPQEIMIIICFGYSPHHLMPTSSRRNPHLRQMVAEAVAAATVHAELAQSGGAGRALGEATGVVSLHHSRH